MSNEFKRLRRKGEAISRQIEQLKKRLATKEGELESILLQLEALKWEGDRD